jgi:hypothetical protein
VSADKQELPGRWNRSKRDLGVALWISFLAACAGTFVIFALLDPAALTQAWARPWEISPRLAYSLGFFFLWVVSLLASGLTIFMLRSGPQSGHSKGEDGRPLPEIRSPEEENPDLDLDDIK